MSGQASVSFVAVVPLLLLLGIGVLQAAIAGHASVAATHAARAAARAGLTGEAAEDAVRAALPTVYRESAKIDASGSTASVRLTAPRVLPFGPRIALSSSAYLGPMEGRDG